MFRKNPAFTSLLVCLSAITTIWISGCGGSSKPLSVAVSASAATVDGTDAVSLTATVTNDKNSAGVTWSLSGGGALSNSTTSAATYTAPAATNAAQTVTVTATSVANTAQTASTTLTIPAAPAITTASLAAGAVGTAYTQTLTASGGIPPYTWALASGTLPSCLTITQSSSGASIGGTPTAACAGSSQLTFKVTDAGSTTALTATSAQLTLAISAAPAISFPSPATLAAATYNVAYTGSVAATGGAGALTYSVSAGALPTGLQLNSATGAITGTPTAAGAFAFTVKGTDGFGDSASVAFAITVSYSAISVAPATLPVGYVGSNYTQSTLSATGGSGTGYSWTVATGSSLPAGLSLSTGGVISGKPTASGTTSFTVKVTDSASNSGTGSFSITVNAGVSITTPTTLPAGYVGGSYSQTLAATGGTGTGYAWAVTSGSTLPAGLTLSSGGLLSGKPTAGGTLTFSLTVTDSSQNSASATFSLTVTGGIIISTPTTLPSGYQGAVYSGVTLAATGGSGTGYVWTWAAAGGSSLPAGLTLSSAGAIAGTPTGSGTFNVVITVTDSANNTASSTFSVTVEAELAITTTSPLKSGNINAAYSQFLAASGGSGTGFTWSTNSAGIASLAAVNLALSAGGAVFGTPLSTGTATFAATVTDSQSHTATATLSVTISNALNVTTTTLPYGTVGTAYSQTLAAAGGSGTGYTWTATSSNLSTYGLSLSTSGAITGTPTTSGTASFTANVTDSASNTASAPLTIAIYGALALPPPNPNSLGSATLNQSYSGTITATGGSGNYSWTVTGLPSNGLNSTSSNATLNITGTPTTTTTVSFTASVKDTTTNVTVGPFTYTIQVNTLSQVSGQIDLTTNCGNNSNVPPITVSINTNPVQTTTTDTNGNYSFANVPNGTYTITPSISGASSVFIPATLTGITVNNNPVSGKNFNASIGYTVSGSVGYTPTATPTNTGWTYVTLTGNNCGGGGNGGTSISEATLTSGGAFTIRGVPPGSYTLNAWMDNLGYGVTNYTNPTGSASVTVGSANVTGASVTMTDPTIAAPNANPTIENVTPTAMGVVIDFKPPTISSGGNSVEDATSYTVEWSTSPTLGGGTGGLQFLTVAGSWTFKAVGTNGNVWILNDTVTGSSTTFSNGPYYFQVRAFGPGATHPSGWSNWYGGGSSTTFAPVTIGIPTCPSCFTVSGTVTIPNGITPTGPLYVGLYNQDNGSVYAEEFATAASSNSYSVSVPSGTNYVLFYILDQNNDGSIDAGDVNNTNQNGNPLSVTANLSGQNMTLASANSTATVQTNYYSNTSPSGSATGYDLNFQVEEVNELPVAVTLASVSNPTVMTPVDIGLCGSSCGSQKWSYFASLGSAVPNIGDTYTFNVTYSNGSTGTAVATVTGWNGTNTIVGASDLATSLAPTGTSSTSTTPTFTWIYPANASAFSYSFYLSPNNGGSNIWQVPSQNANANGFTSSQVPMPAGLVWGVDPTDSSNTPSSALTSGDTYNWQIQVQDGNGNQAQTQVYYIP